MADHFLYFVWRETQRGPAKCEVWFSDRAADFKPVPTLAKHLLTGEQAWAFAHGAMSMGELAALYPAPPLPDRNVFP